MLDKKNKEIEEIINFVQEEYVFLESYNFHMSYMQRDIWQTIFIWQNSSCLIKLFIDTKDFFSVIHFLPSSYPVKIAARERIYSGLLLHEALETVGEDKVKEIYRKYGMALPTRKKNKPTGTLSYDNIKKHLLRDKEVLEVSLNIIIKKYKLHKFTKPKGPLFDAKLIQEAQRKAKFIEAMDNANFALRNKQYEEILSLLLPFDDILTSASKKLIDIAKKKIRKE